MKRRSLAFLVTFVAILPLLPRARARGDGSGAGASSKDAKTLERLEDPVVLTRAELPKLRRVAKDLLRAYAKKDGKLVPIRFQIDARTPELNYLWTQGQEPVEDKIDDDDEVVFMARDSGDRAGADVLVPGATARHEIELQDPRTGARGWVYLFGFSDPEHGPPEPAPGSYVSLVFEPPSSSSPEAAVFTGETFRVRSPEDVGKTGRPVRISFRTEDGSFGKEVVHDAARTDMHASYLFVRIDREGSEARTSLGSSYIAGPVRIVTPLAIEAYLIWGNWISAARSTLYVYRSTWEHRIKLAVPVNLDDDAKSEARIAVELVPGAQGWRFSNDRNPKGIGPGEERGLDRTFPSWNLLAGPEGAVLSRLELDPRLKSSRNGLFYDRGDGSAGLRAGFLVDVTGLKRTEESTPYEISYGLHFLRSYKPGDEADFVRIHDAPLVRAVR